MGYKKKKKKKRRAKKRKVNLKEFLYLREGGGGGGFTETESGRRERASLTEIDFVNVVALLFPPTI